MNDENFSNSTDSTSEALSFGTYSLGEQFTEIVPDGNNNLLKSLGRVKWTSAEDQLQMKSPKSRRNTGSLVEIDEEQPESFGSAQRKTAILRKEAPRIVVLGVTVHRATDWKTLEKPDTLNL